MFGELVKYPIFPILKRPTPVLDAVKRWEPLIPRGKLLGAFGLTDPSNISVEIEHDRLSAHRAGISVQL
jgi:hypothetical protein